MRPTANLSLLAAAVNRRLARLRAITAAADLAIGPDRDRRVAYVTIESLNTWGQFCRAYYLSWLFTPNRTARGSIAVATACRRNHGCPAGSPTNWTTDQAIAHAINRNRTHHFVTPGTAIDWSNRMEPAWHKTDTILELSGDLSCSNSQDIAAALSTGTRVFVDLPFFRHFYAHRSERTAAPAIALGPMNGVRSHPRPTEVLLERALGRPQSLLSDWLDEIDLTAADLCR